MTEANLPPGPGGTASAPTQVTSVKDVWENHLGDWDKDESHKLTQREFDKLKEGIEKNVDYMIDLNKNPDPLIAIVRTFRKANNMYYTSIIPSGRLNGMVSPGTYRQYVYLGNGTPGTPEKPGYGPWAIESVYEAWNDGVMKVLEDQQYRKILSNVKFVVAGSEDKFNPVKKESFLLKDITEFKKIFEAEARTTGESSEQSKEKKSQGQILFDFINDMLDKQTAADFDGARRKLLKKYFGVGGSTLAEDKKEVGSRTSPPQIDPADREKNTIIWKPFSKAKFDISHKKHFFAFPIDDLRKDRGGSAKKEIIFLQVIDIIGDKALVKFTYDHQSHPNVWKSAKFNTYKMSNWSLANQTTPAKYVYMGLLLNSNLNQRLKISYTNINNSSTSGYALGDVYGEPITSGKEDFKITTAAKKTKMGDIVLVPSILVRQDENMAEQPVNPNDIKVHAESNDNNLKNLLSGQVFDKLSEKGKSWGFWS